MNRIILPVLALLLGMALSGCGQMPTREPPSHVWTRVIFYWQWPPDEAPAWHREVWLTDAVIAPLYEKHALEIPLWRVHRRASRPTGGHFFSWYLFASPALGDELFDEIRLHPMVARLLEAGLLTRIEKRRVTRSEVPVIAATSDRNWDVTVQSAWPWFAMGVSATWMNLIDQLSQPPPKAELAELDAYYRSISDKVDALWQHQGGHAFLHHLNAIYGYLPVLTGPDRLQRF